MRRSSDLLLVELHVRDAVHEQAAGAVGALEDGHACGRRVLSWAAAARPAGPEPMTATFLPVRTLGGSRHHPALLPALFDDRVLDVLDRDRRVVDAEHAGAFARRGTDAAGELGEVVGLVQPLERLAPEAAVDQVVPLGDQVVDRAARGHAADQLAGVAEGHAAIHAAGALVAELLLLHVVMKLVPVAHALQRRTVHGQFPQIFDESSWFAHGGRIECD